MKTEFYAEYYEIEHVHWWFLGRWRIFADLLDEVLGQRRGTVRALDVGCGTGTWLGHLEAFGPAFGVDYSADAARFCRSRGREHVVQGSAVELPVADASFDLVCALDMLEHVQDDIASLRELGRVCCPGGHVLVTVPAYQFLWGRQDEISLHLRRYTARGLRRAIEAAGLCVTRLTYFNTILFPVVAALRLGRRILPGSWRDDTVSDFSMTRPGRVNDLLARIFGVESALVGRVSLPFGVSILALASKPNVGLGGQ